MSARVEVIYWRDIPAQVIAREGRNGHRVELPLRFQEAIDRAATRAGLTGTDDYLAECRKERAVEQGDAAELAAIRATVLEENFTDAMLAEYVANEAWKP